MNPIQNNPSAIRPISLPGAGMPGGVGGIGGPGGLGGTAGTEGTSTSGTSFAQFLRESIEEVNTMQKDADAAVESLMTGESNSPAEVLTAVQKADLAFRLMLQVRNKLVSAFDEVKNLRI